jgi:hypothetical protein
MPTGKGRERLLGSRLTQQIGHAFVEQMGY